MSSYCRLLYNTFLQIRRQRRKGKNRIEYPRIPVDIGNFQRHQTKFMEMLSIVKTFFCTLSSILAAPNGTVALTLCYTSP